MYYKTIIPEPKNITIEKITFCIKATNNFVAFAQAKIAQNLATKKKSRGSRIGSSALDNGYFTGEITTAPAGAKKVRRPPSSVAV